MRNKFFFGVVGFFLVCLFVLFAFGVGRAAALMVTKPVRSVPDGAVAVVRQLNVPDQVVLRTVAVDLVGGAVDGEDTVGVVG